MTKNPTDHLAMPTDEEIVGVVNKKHNDEPALVLTPLTADRLHAAVLRCSGYVKA